MATYVIGDLHGCCDEFVALLNTIQFNPRKDRLYLVGDLIARGNKSLQTLETIERLGQSCKTVLGNHDLHFLAVAKGIKKANTKDKTEDLLSSVNLNKWIDFLREKPLFIEDEDFGFLLSHSGINPNFDLQAVKSFAKFAEQKIQSTEYEYFIEHMYGDNPKDCKNLSEIDRFKLSVNSFTRMRYINQDGSLDFACKLPPNEAPKELRVWFECEEQKITDRDIFFGHWASLLGYPIKNNNIFALDTGCVWGNYLTAYCVETKQYFTQQKL